MTPGEGMIIALEASTPGAAIRTSTWLQPAIGFIHILGFTLLAGSAAMFDLRLLGLSRQIPASALARHLLPWSFGSLLFVVPSGLAMFLAHAGELVSSTAFVIKMSLLMAAGLNAAAFHAGVFQSVKQWDIGQRAPTAARLHAAASLVIWISVIGCGRLLATR